jgi:hypothetical protein
LQGKETVTENFKRLLLPLQGRKEKKNASRKPVPEMNARDDGTKRKEIQSIQKRHRWRWLLQAKLESGKPQESNTSSSSSSSSQAVIKKRRERRVEKAN